VKHLINDRSTLNGNYAGDVLNFDIAAEMLEEEGIAVRTVLINDDVAKKAPMNRRGISGLLFAVKIASGPDMFLWLESSLKVSSRPLEWLLL
jgi:dihydroxyacetone kinase-like protein